MFEVTFIDADLDAVLEHNGKAESLGDVILPVDFHTNDYTWRALRDAGRGDFAMLRDEEPESKELDELMNKLGCAETRIQAKAAR